MFLCRRRSPRFACPLLMLGYDDIFSILVHYSTKDILVVAQTCKLLCIYALRTILQQFNQTITTIQSRLHRVYKCDILQVNHPLLVKMREDWHASFDFVIKVSLLFKNLSKKHNLYYKFPDKRKLLQCILNDLPGIGRANKMLNDMSDSLHEASNQVEILQKIFIAHDRDVGYIETELSSWIVC